ncbi:MAG: hypothetical protein GF332_03050 [Candidatus Moranbacteria bacterium]|nr:hypothetical protein [Candidatus Moranbacteria bacterium]
MKKLFSSFKKYFGLKKIVNFFKSKPKINQYQAQESDFQKNAKPAFSIFQAKAESKAPVDKTISLFPSVNCCLNSCFIQAIAIIVLFGLIAYLGYYFFWPKQELQLPETKVLSVQGSALVKKSGQSNWIKLEKNFKLEQGDLIKTSYNSKATLVFFDSACAHISPDSQILLQDLFIDPATPARQQVNLKVISGKVWSRVLQLLDQKARYQVRSNNTVATVRGTAFDFIVSGDNVEITSVESVIQVDFYQDEQKTQKIDNSEFLAENYQLFIDQKLLKTNSDQALIKKAIQADKLKSHRFQENIKLDREFIDYLIEQKNKNLKQDHRILPDSKFYQIEKCKQELVGSFLSDPERFIHYIINRLSEIYLLANQKSFDQAFSQLQDLELFIQANLSNFNDQDQKFIRSKIRNFMPGFSLLMRKSSPGSSLHDLKLRFEDLELKYFSSPNHKQFFQLKNIEKRVNESRGKINSHPDQYCDQLEQALKSTNELLNQELQSSHSLKQSLKQSRRKYRLLFENNCLKQNFSSKSSPKPQTQNSNKTQPQNQNRNNKAKPSQLLDQYQQKASQLISQAGDPEQRQRTLTKLQADAHKNMKKNQNGLKNLSRSTLCSRF